VVRHDDDARTVLDRERGIRGGEHALHHERELRRGADAVDVGPVPGVAS
jgi:hypothetical protein